MAWPRLALLFSALSVISGCQTHIERRATEPERTAIKAMELENLRELEHAADPSRRLELYQDLLWYDPKNEGYAAEVERLSVVVEEKERLETAALVNSPARKLQVLSMFSAQDGSHPGLVKSVRDSLNDPRSFVHVETRYRDDGRVVVLFMKMRGTNAFGGVLTKLVRAEVAATGELLLWEFMD